MNKVIRFSLAMLLVLLVAVCSVSVSAAASGIDAATAADALHTLGLLRGVGTNADGSVNFDINGSLTRAQSITQVVRFRGAENEALSKKNAHPFTDLAEWAVPYVSYAYANGITQGVSATKFDGDGAMSDFAFLTMVLRTLGYSDSSGDFVWNAPYALAKKAGLIASETPDGNFTRGDAFVICYNALTASPKSGDTIAKQLISKGLFTPEQFEAAIASGRTLNADTELVEFSLLEESVVFEAPSRWENLALSYGAMTVLQHSGANDGTIFATLNAGSAKIGDASGYCYKILKSVDGGKTWEFAGAAKDDFNVGINATYAISTPSLFELPENVGAFKAGTLFLAGVSKDGVKTSEIKVSAITLFYSTDLGKTWKAYATLDKAGGENEGVWEPFLIYDSGRVYCFYSDDSDPAHSQKIVFKWTSDLVNWTGADGTQDCTVKTTASTVFGEPLEAVACEKQNLRPSMPSVVKMNNGQFLMTFEMVGIAGSPVYYKTTDNLANWGDAANYGMPVATYGNILGGAPWVAYSSLGGECGTLIMGAFRNVVGSSKYSGNGTDLFISHDYGKTWSRAENPILYTIMPDTTVANAAYYRGYSPTLAVSADGTTLYCLNITEYPYNDNSTSLKFARVGITERSVNNPDNTEKKPTMSAVDHKQPAAYKGLEYKFDVNGYTFYSHYGTWEVVTAAGEDKGALHLKEGKGIALVEDINFSKNITISAKVKLGATAKAGNFGYAMNAWWNEDGNYDKNWQFYENNTAGYFYCYLSGARSAGLIGKYDGGTSANGSTGWESFNAGKIASYGINASDVYNGGVLAGVAWEQGKYYDYSCTWDVEALTMTTYLNGIKLYSVKFPYYPLSVVGNDFGFRSNVADVYFKDIKIVADSIVLSADNVVAPSEIPATPNTPTVDAPTVDHKQPTAYKGLEYKFDVDGYTFYSHYGTWEVVTAAGEDKGALHLKEGKGIALVEDINFSKNITISAKVKLGATAKAGNFGYAMNAWWNEDGNYDKNWQFYENNTAGYFYCYLSGARSAGLIGKYDGGTSANGSTGWESFNAGKIASYGINASDVYNGGELAGVAWEQGKYYDYSCTWDVETLTMTTYLNGIKLYSVKFPYYPLSVEGNDFGFRSNVADVYFKDINISIDK